MEVPDSPAARRDLVRRGYDAVSVAYRSDGGEPNDGTDESTVQYRSWIAELAAHLPVGARILDIGCGNGLPADRAMAEMGFDVTGVDISALQIERARVLVPQATFLCAGVVEIELPRRSFDAIVSLYALIHVPLEDQRALFRKIHQALRPAGMLLAIVGAEQWTGVADYFGAPMFWDHADTVTSLAWLREDGFEVLWHRYVPEGDVGHTLLLAQRP